MSDELDEQYKPVSKEEFDKAMAETMRGVRATFSGMRQDNRGNMIRELRVVDDEFAPGQREKVSEQYIMFHRMNHKIMSDPNCKVCQSELSFKQNNPDLVGKRIEGRPRCQNCGQPFEMHIKMGNSWDCPQRF